MEGCIIVLTVFLTVAYIVRLSLRHAENIERIRHGYPLLDNTVQVKRTEDVIDARQQ